MNIVQYGSHVSFEDVILFSCCLLPLIITAVFLGAMFRVWLKGRLNAHHHPFGKR